tara:strand:- start:11 stop:397 length:387 start_codon:yes stop_codon:yes gene_type:complete
MENKEYINTLKKLKTDLYINQAQKSCMQFMQSSVLHLAISLEVGVGTDNSKHISYEKICSNIPKKLGSRSTIQTILNDAIKSGYFIKETSKEDKRVKIYKYSKQFANEIDTWLIYHKENFINYHSHAA